MFILLYKMKSLYILLKIKHDTSKSLINARVKSEEVSKYP